MVTKALFMDDYLFTGPYEEKARKLIEVIDKESEAKIFNSAVELYIASVVVGCFCNKTCKIIKSSTHLRIMGTQFTSRYDELMFLYKLVMLNADKEFTPSIDRINNAFRYADKEENMLTFEKYMLGGLSEIYDNFFISSNKRCDDYLASLYSFISKFTEDSKDDDDIDLSGDVFDDRENNI